MEEYSYISENGTVRQIRDLIAKAKDAEQDEQISQQASGISQLRTQTENALKTKSGVTSYVDDAGAAVIEFLRTKCRRVLASGIIDISPSGVIIPGGWNGVAYGVSFAARQTANSMVIVSFVGGEAYHAFYDIANDAITACSKFSGVAIPVS